MNFTCDNIAILGIAVIFYALFILFYADSMHADIAIMIYVLPVIAASIMSYSLSKRYKKIPHFRLGYLFLSVSMGAYAIADILWIILGNLGLEQYPSLTDIFYASYFIFAILHPLAILKFFEVTPKLSHFILFGIIIIGSITTYCIFSHEAAGQDSFYVGLFFVSLTSTLFGVSVVTILSLRGRQIFKVWVIIGIAFLINSITDIHYYISENYKDWSVGDWENIAWFVAQILIVYALLEHRQKYRVLQN